MVVRQRKDRWRHAKIVFTLTFDKSMFRRISQVKQYMEKLRAAFNRHASSMGWSCRLRLDLSKEAGYVHIHALLEATLGWTAFHWIRAYWHMWFLLVKPYKIF